MSPEIQAFVRTREIPVTDPLSPEGLVLMQGQPLLVGDVQTVWDRIHPLNQLLALMTQAQGIDRRSVENQRPDPWKSDGRSNPGP